MAGKQASVQDLKSGHIQEVSLPFSYEITRSWQQGFIDSLHVDSSGLLRIEGWWRGVFEAAPVPAIYLDEHAIPLFRHFRFNRPDVSQALNDGTQQPGLELDYLIPEHLMTSTREKTCLLAITLPGIFQLQFRFLSRFIVPHYEMLWHSSEVFHRSNIYGSGPSNKFVHPEVFDLARQLPAPILDFGCGKGALVSQLRMAGIEAYGLELGSEQRRSSVPADISSYISFYDGNFPSPFADGQFNSVVCSEVLEHIPAHREAVRDISRLARQAALFTVPDASAIPVCFRHGVVPWHLLEGTHVNFFNLVSLEKALREYFPQVQLGKMGVCALNDSRFFVSLTARCSK